MDCESAEYLSKLADVEDMHSALLQTENNEFLVRIRVFTWFCNTFLMQFHIKNLSIVWYDFILFAGLYQLHAGDRLHEWPFQFAIFHLTRVLDLLQESRLPHPFVYANRRRCEKNDESLETLWIDYPLNQLSWWRRVERRLRIRWIFIDVSDKGAIILAKWYREADFASIRMCQAEETWSNLSHATLSVHVVLQDHMKFMDLDMVVWLTNDNLRLIEDFAEDEGAWYF